MSLTAKAVAYVASEEGMVQEMYYDTEKVATWALGVTDASGHKVGRYKDNPQPLQKCCDVSVWLMRNKYLPDVVKAFGPRELTESQLAAALSFHWNTGRILTTDWVKMFNRGEIRNAEQFLKTHYLNGGVLQSRRNREADLFFRGVWPSLLVPVYPVNKPSYTPSIRNGKRVDLTAQFAEALKK